MGCITVQKPYVYWVNQVINANSESFVRSALHMFATFKLFIIGLAAGGLVHAQEVPTDELLDPEMPQQERICDLEIDMVETALDDHGESFEPIEQERLRTQLDEAQAYCDDGNEVMAAIRLEAVTAVIEVTGSGN